jgi:serine protease DegQ
MSFVSSLVLATVLVAAQEPPKAAKTYEIPYRLTDTKHVLVRAKLNGKGPYNFILDTGAPAVFIPKKIAKAAGVELDDNGWGTFDKFEIEGGLKVDKARTRVEDLFQLEGMNGMGLAGVELHGVIGYNVLAQFRITYDFNADKLNWVSLEGFQPPAVRGLGGKSGGQGGLEILGPAMKMMAGFMGIKPNFTVNPRGFIGISTTESKSEVLVESVLAGSPADKAGVKKGDKIEAVGVTAGKRKPSMTDVDRPKDFQKAIAEAKVGDTIKLQLKRGDATETLTFTLGTGL